jgi:hypothetical protein
MSTCGNDHTISRCNAQGCGTLRDCIQRILNLHQFTTGAKGGKGEGVLHQINGLEVPQSVTLGKEWDK